MFVAFPLVISFIKVSEEGCVLCFLHFLGNYYRHVRKVVFCVFVAFPCLLL